MVTAYPWLTVLWAIPTVGAALVMVLPAGRSAQLAKWTGTGDRVLTSG